MTCNSILGILARTWIRGCNVGLLKGITFSMVLVLQFADAGFCQTETQSESTPWALYIGDNAHAIQVKPVIIANDRIYMALDAVRILGGELSYSNDSKLVTALLAGKNFQLSVSTSKAKLDGNLVPELNLRRVEDKWYLAIEDWEAWGFKPVWHPVFKSWQVIGKIAAFNYDKEGKDFIFETALPSQVIESQDYSTKEITLTVFGAFLGKADFRKFGDKELESVDISEDIHSRTVTFKLRQTETTGFRTYSDSTGTTHRVNFRNHFQLAEFEQTSSGEIMIKIKFGKPTELQTLELTGPDRLVLDFSGSIYAERTASINVGIGRVQRIRIGQFSQPPDPYVVRVVVDLAGKVGYRIIQTANKDTYYVQFLERKTGKFAIIIDAGHGGSDPGALSRFSEMQEKELNLEISKRVRDILERNGQTVIMTRDDDYFVTLAERADLANRLLPMFFVSIHNNSIENPDISGAMTFHHAASSEGKKLATFIQRRMVSEAGADDKGVRTANFYVLRETIVPAALVECGFLTNESEELKLRDPAYRQALAQAIANGILDYCATLVNN